MPGESASRRRSRMTNKGRRNADAAMRLIRSTVSTQLGSSDPVAVEAGCRQIEAFGRELLRGGVPRAVVAVLSDSERGWSRERCAATVAKVGATQAMAKVLVKAVSDPDCAIRDFACQALGNGHIRSASRTLLRATRDEDDQVRFSAIEALSCLNVPFTDRLIARCLSDRSPLARLSMILAIGD
jgi:HEAT repeats